MSDYKENFLVKDGVLHIGLSGKFPNTLFSQGRNLFQPLIDACLTHNCKKALIDARDLRVNFGAAELFQAGKDAAFLTHIGLRVALLAREDMRDTFFDNVVVNRGGNVGVFTDMDTASEWLHS